MTEKEALIYVKAHGADWEDRSEYVRYCGDCGNWLEVDLYCGTEDRCDSCADEVAGRAWIPRYNELVSIIEAAGVSCGESVMIDKHFWVGDKCEAAGVVAEAEELMAIVDSVLSRK